MPTAEHIPLPGPTRRVALGPHTDSLCRRLEPGESVEVVNEGDRPAWLCVDAWTTRAALEATRQRDEAIGRAEAAEAEAVALRVELDHARAAADRDRASYRMAAEGCSKAEDEVLGLLSAYVSGPLVWSDDGERYRATHPNGGESWHASEAEAFAAIRQAAGLGNPDPEATTDGQR